MLYLVFGHTAEEPPLRVGPMPSFKVRGAEIIDHASTAPAWSMNQRSFYRVDCDGPVLLRLEGAPPRGALGPFEHFSLFNGTAYASRGVFAHYNEHDDGWHLHRTDERCAAIQVTAA